MSQATGAVPPGGAAGQSAGSTQVTSEQKLTVGIPASSTTQTSSMRQTMGSALQSP